MHVIRDSPLFLLQMDSPEGKHLRKRKYPLAGRDHPFVQRSKRHLRLFTGICNMPRKNNPPQPLSRTLWRPCYKTYRRFLHKKERGLPAFRWQTSWRRWRDSNSRAGFEPTYRISSADPSTAWVHLQIYVISLVPTRRPIQPVEIGKNNRIEQATLFNLNSAGTRMVPWVSAVWHSA